MSKIIDDDRLSRFLSLVLRHEPDHIGIVLDCAGWTDINTLIRKASSKFAFDRAQLNRVVEKCEKKRFTISDNGHLIRAAQGHSVLVNLDLTPRQPPEMLYHGTATRFLDSILREGINSGNRQMVHLSTDMPTATVVGRRHGNPVIIQIDVAAMVRDGREFFCADNGVWLTRHVEAKFFGPLLYP